MDYRESYQIYEYYDAEVWFVDPSGAKRLETGAFGFFDGSSDYVAAGSPYGFYVHSNLGTVGALCPVRRASYHRIPCEIAGVLAVGVGWCATINQSASGRQKGPWRNG